MTRRDLSVALLKIAASFLPACQQLRSDRFADDDVPAGRYAPGLELPGPVETVVCVGKIVKVRCPYPPLQTTIRTHLCVFGVDICFDHRSSSLAPRLVQ